MIDDDQLVNVVLPTDLHAALKIRATADDRSMAATIREALRAYLTTPLPPWAQR